MKIRSPKFDQARFAFNSSHEFRLYAEAQEENNRLLLEAVEKAERSEFGPGKLYVVNSSGEDLRILRLVNVKDSRERREKRYINNRKWSFVFLREDWKPFDGSFTYGRDSVLVDYLPAGDDPFTQEELQDLFDNLPRISPKRIKEIFPDWFQPTVYPGRVFFLGACSHHSGDIEAKGIVLPTGRMAVVSSYEGEWGDSVNLEGVTGNPFVGIDLSAKSASFDSEEELEVPTWAELEFLRSGEVTFDVDIEYYLECLKEDGRALPE